jgi:hypothetical protein
LLWIKIPINSSYAWAWNLLQTPISGFVNPLSGLYPVVGQLAGGRPYFEDCFIIKHLENDICDFNITFASTIFIFNKISIFVF